MFLMKVLEIGQGYRPPPTFAHPAVLRLMGTYAQDFGKYQNFVAFVFPKKEKNQKKNLNV